MAASQIARRQASEWARAMLDEDFVILDTETTGLWPEDEIVEIAVIDRAGAVLLEQRIRPLDPARLLKRDARSGLCAVDIHGITPDMLESEPGFASVYETLRPLIQFRPLVIYNADYDMKMLNQDCARHRLAMPLVNPACAMKQFAAWRGVPGKYPGEYRWAKLEEAVTLLGVESDSFAEDVHSALGDCQRTLAVLTGMAQKG